MIKNPYLRKCLRCKVETKRPDNLSYVCRDCKKHGLRKNPLSWQAIRKMAFNVLGSKCKVCGTTENLHIHHKDKNRLNNNLSNLEVRCHQCHPSLHKTNERKVAGVYNGIIGNRIIY